LVSIKDECVDFNFTHSQETKSHVKLLSSTASKNKKERRKSMKVKKPVTGSLVEVNGYYHTIINAYVDGKRR
jgi:hypothetical protein